MNITKLLKILLSRWKIALFVFLVAGAAGGTWAWFTPKTYTSNAVVVVDSKADPVAGVAQIMTPNFLATQVDIIRSSRVGNKVIKAMKLDENQILRKQFIDNGGQGSFDEWLSQLLQRSLVVEPGRGSNVLRISYTSIEPKFAALMANAFVKAYLDVVLDMRIEPARRYSEFFDDRAKTARENLEKAQAKLSAYQKEKGIIATDERADIENTRLNELSSQLSQIQAQVIDSSSRQNQAQSAADRTQEVLASGIVTNLRSELIKNETKLLELLSKFGDNHPQVQEAKVTIADLKLKIEGETKRVTGSMTVNNTVNRQREGEIRAALDAQKAKVLRLKEVRDDLIVYQREVENAQRSYDNLLGRFNQSALESQNQQTSISILNQAEVSNDTPTKLLLKNLAKALIMALGAAGAAAFAMEFFDKRIRVVDDVENAIDLPVIGIMPKPDSKSIFRKRKPTLLQSRIVRSLPSPSSR